MLNLADESYFPQTEAQNCLEEARQVASSLGADIRAAADAAFAAGKVVVLFLAPYYCRATNALAGEYPFDYRAADTLEEATALQNTLHLEDDEVHAKLLIPDHLKPVPTPAPIVHDDSEPF